METVVRNDICSAISSSVTMPIYPSDLCIHFLMNTQYIKNVCPEKFLQLHHFEIPLSEYICYCVGFIQNQKIIHCLRILQKTPSEKMSTILIEWRNPINLQENIQFWVSSGIACKRKFFLHEDQLNFFRSTFIYCPVLRQYFRLSTILHFLKLEENNPMNCKIYSTPLHYRIFKKRMDNIPDKLNNKRCKEFKKSLQKIKKKFNIDNFLQETYPAMYQIIENTLNHY